MHKHKVCRIITREWIAYSFSFMIPFTLASSAILGLVLKYILIEPERSSTNKKKLAFLMNWCSRKFCSLDGDHS